MRNAVVTSIFFLLLAHFNAGAQTSTTVVFSGAAPFLKENLQPNEVASGFAFTEGPTPDGAGGIWFTDINRSNIHRFDIATGMTTLESDNSGGANGLLFDSTGRLLVAEGFSQRLTRIDGDAVEVLADSWNDAKLNSPNDIALDSNGGIYFTDPAYFQDVQAEGVYYVSPEGNVSQVISGLSRPNGIALSPDETTLYVAEPTATPFPGNPEMKLWEFDVPTPGEPNNPRIFVEGLFVDGLTVDAFGNVFGALFQGYGAWTPEGEPIFWEQTPDATTNLVFENPDGTYPNRLFITAGGSLYRTELLPVPEPSSIQPVLIGCACVCFAMRRR